MENFMDVVPTRMISIYCPRAGSVCLACLKSVRSLIARQNSLKFNSKKSRAIVFTNKRSMAWKETDFSICGEHLSEREFSRTRTPR